MDSAFFSPLEVEEVLEAMPEVGEAAVWGSTDSRGGNDLVNVALVVKMGNKLTREEVVAKVAGTLHPRKQITGKVRSTKSKATALILKLENKFTDHQVVFLDRIPHNPQGKKLRQQLKEKYSGS